MKVAEDGEDPFKENKHTIPYYLEDDTYYVQNTDDNRSRRDNWRNDLKSKGYVRSDSHPRFFRMASKNTYVRYNSRFDRRGANVRSDSRSGGNFTRPRSNAKQGMRSQSKSQERPKSEIFQKVESLEKDMKEIKEMLKGKFVNTQFVEEEVIYSK